MANQTKQSFPTDKALIEGIRAKEERQVKAMWNKYNEFKTTAAHLRNLGADWDDSRHCTDLAVVKFINKVQQGAAFPDESEGCIGRWVNHAAVWNHQEWRRQKSKYHQVLLTPDNDPVALNLPDWSDIEKQTLNDELEVIGHFIAALSTTCREYITKRYVDGVELEEFPTIFPQLKTHDSVKNSIAKCLKKLRELVHGAAKP